MEHGGLDELQIGSKRYRCRWNRERREAMLASLSECDWMIGRVAAIDNSEWWISGWRRMQDGLYVLSLCPIPHSSGTGGNSPEGLIGKSPIATRIDYLETKKLLTSEIAKFYGIPPVILGAELKPEDRERLRAEIERQYSGTENEISRAVPPPQLIGESVTVTGTYSADESYVGKDGICNGCGRLRGPLVAPIENLRCSACGGTISADVTSWCDHSASIEQMVREITEPCPDCNGTRQYQPLVGPPEPCKTCCGE